MRDPKSNSTNIVASCSKQEDPGPPVQWTLRRVRQDLDIGLRRRHNDLCLCKAHKHVGSTRGQAKTLLQEGVCYIQSLTKLEIRPETTCIYGQSRAQQQYGKAKDHCQKTLQMVSTLERPKRGESTGQLRKDGTCTQSISKVSVTKDVHESNVKSGIIFATTQTKTDPEYPETKAEREALWRGWRITIVDNSGRAADVKQSPEYSSAPQLTLERQVRNNRKR